MINIEAFQTEWQKINEKLIAVSKIQKLQRDIGRTYIYSCGSLFDGMEIDDSGILYKTLDSYNGCDDDRYSFIVSWDEINNPISYFEDKYAKEIDDWKESVKQSDLSKKSIAEQKEKEEFERLKIIYG